MQLQIHRIVEQSEDFDLTCARAYAEQNEMSPLATAPGDVQSVKTLPDFLTLPNTCYVWAFRERRDRSR